MNSFTFIILGAGAYALYMIYNWYSSSSSWVQAEGSIEKVHVQENFNRNNNTNKNSVEFIVNLEYQFQVNTSEYRGGTIYPGAPNVFHDQRDLDAFMDSHFQGALVPVFYDPENPEKNALKVINSKAFLCFLFIGVLVIVPGMLYVVNVLMQD